jgi:pyruvate,orthophosphate dikinase
VENKELFILQTRTAKRTARAGVCIAVEMVKERLISEREALLRIDAGQMDFYLHAMVEKEFGTYSSLSSDPPICKL